jgi:hypothetical protein
MQVERTPSVVGRATGVLLVSRMGVLGRNHTFMHEQEHKSLLTFLGIFHEIEEDGKLG